MPLARLRALAFAIFTCCVNQIAESRSLWTVDPAHTRVAFVIDAVGWPQTQGRFINFQGKIAIDFNNPSASSVSFKVFAASVDVGSSSFNDFLRGEQFFNVGNHPYISFVSTRPRRSTLGTPMLPEPLPCSASSRSASMSRLTANSRAPDRRDFGMNSGYPAISETVHLIVTTEVFGKP